LAASKNATLRIPRDSPKGKRRFVDKPASTLQQGLASVQPYRAITPLRGDSSTSAEQMENRKNEHCAHD
jgi:hypothetical protein